MASIEERTAVALEAIAYELKRQNDMVAEENNRLVSCAEAAEICHVTKQTVSTWIRQGRIKKIRRGARSGILVNELPQRYEIDPQ